MQSLDVLQLRRESALPQGQDSHKRQGEVRLKVLERQDYLCLYLRW